MNIDESIDPALESEFAIIIAFIKFPRMLIAYFPWVVVNPVSKEISVVIELFNSFSLLIDRKTEECNVT